MVRSTIIEPYYLQDILLTINKKENKNTRNAQHNRNIAQLHKQKKRSKNLQIQIFFIHLQKIKRHDYNN